MRRMEYVLSFVAALVLLCVITLPATAQGCGGGKRRATTVGQGSGQQGQKGQQGQGKQGQAGQGQGQGQMDRDRLRTHTTDQQRYRLRDCTGSADQIRQRARDMTRDASSPAYTADKAKQQRDQLRDQVRIMQQQHEQLQQSLNDEQKTMLQDRLRVMQQQQDRVNTRLQEMDGEGDQGRFDRSRIAQQSREIERAMNEWRNQYRKMSQDMGVKPQQ